MARPKTAAAPLPGGATLPPAGSPDVLYLVDLSGYVFRAYHALPPLSSAAGEPTHAVLGTVNMLQKVVGDRRPALFAVAMDSKGPTFRHALDARYKATRPAPPPDLSQQMSRVEQIVRAWGVAVFSQPGLEADDIIAAATARAEADGWRVVIVSADKDLMQLVHDEDDRVVLWDSMRDRVFGAAEVTEKLGVRPGQVRDYLALTGDTSDNVPGVPGVGPKTAADLLGQLGSIDGIYSRLEEVARPKLRDLLREHEGDARLSLKLVTLDASPSLDWAHGKLRWGGADVDALRGLYTELGFTRQLEQLEKLATQPASATPTSPATAAAAEGPATAPPMLEASALEAIVAEARAAGHLGISVEASSPDAMRATAIGLALSTAAGTGHYLPLAHRYLGCPRLLSWATVTALLGPVLADPAIVKVGHDLKEASIVLGRAGAPVAGRLFDTRVGGYLLDPEAPQGLEDMARRELGVTLPRTEAPATRSRAPVTPFDELDVERAASLVAARAAVPIGLRARLEPRLAAEGLESLMRDVEMPLSRVLGAMQERGILCDAPTLRRLSADAERQLAELDAECKKLAGREFLLRSRDQLEAILFDELKLPVVKRTPKGGRSTDADVLEALAEHHPLPKALLHYRELDKLKGTYLDALPRTIHPETGRIHTRFDQTVAATGRLSSSDPNLQNIPVRTEMGRAIRAAFVAPEGHVLLSADYSQIELRVLAHLSGDAALIDAFASDADVHARTAALMFDKTPGDVTSDERRAAKTINFGVIYGMGESALAKQLGIPREQAAKFIAAYFERYSGVARFMDRIVESARQGEAVRTELGRRRFLPNLRSSNRALRLEAERIARNTPIQGTAADILKLAMVRLGEGEPAPGARMLLTVHDELVFEVPARSAELAAERIRAEMSGAMKLSVPLVVDVGWGASWADAH